tara:strand:- start:20083 stop:20517 length:435 start_codon:yes stop_codon:yes gene_type:complete
MIDWDKRYIDLAGQVATWSKDPSKKIGAIVVGDNGQVLCQGYNGFPRGVSDSLERYTDRPTKYKFVVHAEMNAIYNAIGNGTKLAGGSMYVHGLPVCSECAKGIIQTGIKKVFYTADDVPSNWAESLELTTLMFNEAGIELKRI